MRSGRFGPWQHAPQRSVSSGSPAGESRPVKEEVRANAVARIAAGEPLFERVLGYEQTVLPQLENALLAGHDVIFLGERGQAKTRIIRSLTGLLDEWMPIIAGSEINDDPYAPVSRHARDLVAEHGEDTPITWVHRDDRFGEKLATPDTSIADLIGEVDPIKVAEGRYLSDELTLHYGLVPRTNRGIFAINELPDLAERIQVGLLNVLEERDIQVRGYKIRLPARRPAGRLGQPRGLHQPRPHHHAAEGPLRQPDPHPLPARGGDRAGHRAPGGPPTVGRRRRRARARVPRRGDHHDQPPGPGEHARQPAQRRERAPVGHQLRDRRRPTPCAAACAPASGSSCPRIDDLEALAASSGGKIEIESLDEGREGAIFDNLVKGAVLTVFKARVAPEQTRDVIAAFEEGVIAHTGEDVPSSDLAALVETVPALRTPVAALTGGDESPAAVAAAVSFVLEGLHLSKRLNKDTSGTRATYRSRS